MHAFCRLVPTHPIALLRHRTLALVGLGSLCLVLVMCSGTSHRTTGQRSMLSTSYRSIAVAAQASGETLVT